MKKKTLIIGGVAGGATTATRLRRRDEEMEIIMFERGKYISYANCGLPYYIGDTIKSRDALLLQTPEAMKSKYNIDVRTLNEVIEIIPDQKKVVVKNLKTNEIYEESYDNLVIATGSSPIKPNISGIDGKNIFTHPAVGAEELKAIYRESDIAIHCESFALKNRLATRLSFSTKIIDCLASGCAVLAVAWEEQTGLKYLKSQDAAVCITDVKRLEAELRLLVSNPDQILSYAEKARNCGIQNHDICRIQKKLYHELTRLVQGR